MLLSFYFSFISFACSWIILCFSLRFFIARVDSASDSFILFSISACKLFCSGPPQCSSCIHQHNSKQILLTISSSSLFLFSSSFFVVFVVFSPRADRGGVYMRVLEKFGEFGGFVATGSRTFRTRVAEVISAAVRGGLYLLLITPWNVCQNPSCYKKRAWLAQAANWTREIFAAVTTRTSYAPCSDLPIKFSLSGGETA